MTLSAIVVMAICIKLGLWQYSKAEAKQALQSRLEAGMLLAPVSLPIGIKDIESWRYRKVKFSGFYEPKFQFFLDNQVDNNIVGYHVLTPIKLENSNQLVLVDRGWIAGSLDRKPPVAVVPAGLQQIEGDIYIPLAKAFTLETTSRSGQWQNVWQNLDMKFFAQAVSAEVKPYVVRLDAKSNAGGFLRNWPKPGERVTMHLGYAYQWFGFALTLLVIYIVLNIKKVKS
ncbi:MAG: SURF1 family protein [Methylophilaceae bacterium]